MGYDRCDSFPFDAIPFGSKSKGKLSPRSYPIQFERNWKYSFLSVEQIAPLGFLQQPSEMRASLRIMGKQLNLFNLIPFTTDNVVPRLMPRLGPHCVERREPLNPFVRNQVPTFAVREPASLGIMGEPQRR